MFANPAASWHHSNQYNEKSACEHCGGVIRHERWCITCDPAVQYAYEVVLDPEKLTLIDRCMLWVWRGRRIGVRETFTRPKKCLSSD